MKRKVKNFKYLWLHQTPTRNQIHHNHLLTGRSSLPCSYCHCYCNYWNDHYCLLHRAHAQSGWPGRRRSPSCCATCWRHLYHRKDNFQKGNGWGVLLLTTSQASWQNKSNRMQAHSPAGLALPLLMSKSRSGGGLSIVSSSAISSSCEGARIQVEMSDGKW